MAQDTPPIASVFNDAYAAEQFERYRQDPASVEESWRQFFRFAEEAMGRGPSSGGGDDYARIVAGAARYTTAIRYYGHMAVQLDPLGSPPPGAEELTPEFHGITEAELELVSGASLGWPHLATAKDVAERLRKRYMRHLAVEVGHLGSDEERTWFRQLFTEEQLTRPLTVEEKQQVLRRLTEVDGFERFLGRTFVGYKRFSIEGTDALVPMLDTAISESAAHGAEHVAISMAHRGRISVLGHVMGKPLPHILGEFQGKHGHLADASTGDVKYHLGFENVREVNGKRVKLSLVPNPSHLEIVNPVLQGAARAWQRDAQDRAQRDESKVVPVCIHGDAAFPGEGIVPETFNLSRLRAYRVGGTLHIIVNNQIGFTTDPIDSRSTHYASDIAKGFEMPIIHVNADNAEACVVAMRIAVAYRARFKKDFLIDLVGYRRWGHNEGDEPTYTQPQLYEKVKAHPTPRQVFAKRMVTEGVVTEAQVEALDKDVAAVFQAAYEESKAPDAPHHPHPVEATSASAPTAVAADRLKGWNEALLTYPSDFTPHPRLAKQLERRREALSGEPAIDWGHAEQLAFASILAEGTHIRMSGQDVERGTFSHRHAVLNDVNTGRKYAPLAALPNAKGTFEAYNSALSELAVLGFEYGFSVAAKDTLTLWEGQFGDFANMAQPMIDQFIVSDRAKWAQDSGLVMLLPHGYEGQGPEHSSARLERFLQMCAESNMRVAYPSSPAQYFHILRRQVKLARRPLVLMQPKSLLRLAQASSTVKDLSEGAFRPVIDDPKGAEKRQAVKRLIFCTGKVYYDLLAAGIPESVAVVRVEELYPWPHEEIARTVDLYPHIDEVAWVQEEPKNMGAWTFVAPRLRVSTGNALVIRYYGRPERASPAEGYPSAHTEEQTRIVTEALSAPVRHTGARRVTAMSMKAP
ncbi:2-oxoglutarate dehydrogenase E1 component [Pseudogemmatithrix spongiicola]|uniref:oxoglutarate dehydrogenase (succinyl-transferring) n=1 Tax=Pseudogemmatithrix spongiicola TaxID=3062599 RepID=A0AA49Q3M1_9BACT|nr:2-oxoglutarate dehydrogenase E1 component [Gemmatimonadaceae bacterium 'strain 138']WKW13886.1 2-oxoglutarate dehydrogenase E1 component [Gemmatimonadaceae bacterium 'strain 318']